MRIAIALLISLPLFSFSQKLKPKIVGQLSEVIHESSGLAKADSNLFWTMNDSGNPPMIYLINRTGNIIYSYTDTLLHNRDWEDLTEDSSTFFIGDFGNNNQRRKDLVIYILYHHSKEIGSPITRIDFRYPDQKEFPPPPSNWNFDCEAFIHHGDSLYLFSKNVSKPNDGYTKLYRLPDDPGNFTTELIDSFYLDEPVTGATISTDGNTLILLTYFSLWVFEDFKGSNFFKGKNFQFPLKGLTQKEAICFVNDQELFLTDEISHGKGGKLYSVDLNHLNFSRHSKYKKQIFKRAIYNAFNNPKKKYKRIMKQESAQ